jgi:ABC-2 type transport system ATP-binding protein
MAEDLEMSLSTYAVETEGLTKRFGDLLAVADLDLRISRGATFGLLGPNGAGKTTIMRLLLDLTPATAGTMRLLDRSIPDQREHVLARVGAIVEEPRFHSHLSGRENLWVIAAARGGPAFNRIGPALTRVALRDRADDRVGTYSMGMRQRLGIAVCLLADPELLILDEPMNGLDPAGMLEFRQLISELAQEGRTVVISSHLLDEIERSCDHIAIVDQGRIVIQGAIAELEADAASAVRFTCDQPEKAAQIAARSPHVDRATTDRHGIHVTLKRGSDGPNVAATLNHQLMLEHVTVFGFQLTQPSLEQRFLEITSRLGMRA